MPTSSYENEAVWILGNYISRAWTILSSGTPVLNEEEFFGFLRFKFKMDQIRATVKMSSFLRDHETDKIVFQVHLITSR